MPLLCTYDCSFISRAGKVGKLKEKRNESQLNTSLWPLTLVWFCVYVVYHPNTFCMFWIACPYCAQFPFPCAWHMQSGKEHEVQSSICQPENFHLEFGLMAGRSVWKVSLPGTHSVSLRLLSFQSSDPWVIYLGEVGYGYQYCLSSLAASS